MATATKPKAKERRGVAPADYELAVCGFDRVASTIIAFLVLLGLGVLGLLIVVYSMRVFTTPIAAKVVPAEAPGGGEDPGFGLAEDPEPLGEEEAPELDEPQLRETLAVVSQAVATTQARLDDEKLDGKPVSSRGKGKGDRRGVGSGSGPGERVPRHERWEIRFQGTDLDTYARQLDFFEIELAALDKSANLVRYAFNVSKDRPDSKTGPPGEEKRLYMIWQGGRLANQDRALLGRAGVEPRGMIILQFYPPAAENQLAQKELAAAGNRSVNDIRKTIFAVTSEGGGYSFSVITQRFF